MTASLRRRVLSLQQDQATTREWRQLQFEAIREYLAGQRRFIALHSELLAAVVADRELHRRQRDDAHELYLALSELHRIVHDIGMRLSGLPDE